MRKMAKRLNFLEFLFDFAQTIGYNLPCLKQSDAILAQLVEQLICNQQVVGSSPTNGSKSETPVNIAFAGVLLCLDAVLKTPSKCRFG